MVGNTLTYESVFDAYEPKLIQSSGQYRMMCPFRENHTVSGAGAGLESFFINPELNAYHCFSCGVSGNLVKLLTSKLSLLSLFDAYDLVGMQSILNYFEDNKGKSKKVDRSDEIPIIHFDVLPPSLLERGFSSRVLKAFSVGFTDVEYRGEIIQDVIVTPIYDNFGETIVNVKHRKNRSFWYVPDQFDKENYLYNYHRCIGKDWCVVVEGETDTYGSCQNGVWNTCALNGGTMSRTQAKLLTPFKKVKLAFDNDDAGMLKTEEAVLMLHNSAAVEIVMYPSDDPGSIDQISAKEWRECVDNSISYLEYSVAMAHEYGDAYIKTKETALKHYKRRLR